LSEEDGVGDFAAEVVGPLEGRRLANACLKIDWEWIEERRVFGCAGHREGRAESEGDTCDVENAGFIVCSKAPNFVPQLRGKLGENGEHCVGGSNCSNCRARVFYCRAMQEIRAHCWCC